MLYTYAAVTRFALVLCVLSPSLVNGKENLNASDSRHCPTPWRSYSNRCYLFTKTHASWFDAQVFCRSVKARLAQPKSYSAYNNIYNVVKHHMRTAVWLGASDIVRENHYKWLSGGTMNTWRWHRNEPSGGRVENCMAIRPDGMHDYPCHHNLYFVCEK